MVRTGDINCWKDISRVVCFLLLPIQQVLLTGNIAGSTSHIETVRLSKASTETYRVTHKLAQGIRIHYASQVFSDFIVHFQYYEQVRGFVFFVVWYQLILPISFSQYDFTSIGLILWVRQCQWSNPKEYGQSNPTNPPNVTTSIQQKTQICTYFIGKPSMHTAILIVEDIIWFHPVQWYPPVYASMIVSTRKTKLHC